MGDLDLEEQARFVASDSFNLRSPFLRALLADSDTGSGDHTTQPASSTRSATAAGAAGPGSSAPAAATMRPSEANWDTW